jgi:hypothetical protein
MFEIKFNSYQLQNKNSEDTTFPEAIETIYDFGAKIFVNWNDIEIPISLKMDVSDSWMDIQSMVKSLNSDLCEFKMEWPSQSFFAVWEIVSLNNAEITVTPKWHDKPETELRVDRSLFTKEWEKVIIRIVQDIEKQGYNVDELELI